MGNQASKVIEKTKERRGNKTRRKSTATVGGGRSHSSLSISHASSSNSHGNYDWVEPSSGSGAIDAAMAAAGMADVRKPAPPMMTAAGGDNDTTSTTTTTTPTLTPRRKSVSEILARRKGSFSRISTSQEDFREYDRLQRQVSNPHVALGIDLYIFIIHIIIIALSTKKRAQEQHGGTDQESKDHPGPWLGGRYLGVGNGGNFS